MENLEKYRQRLEQINGMVTENKKDFTEKKRLRNQLIREIAPRFRQTNRQEYLELLIQLFKRPMNAAVVSKIPADGRKDVLAEIYSAIFLLAKIGVKTTPNFPLEETAVDQVAYINRIIANKIYDYYDYLRRPTVETNEDEEDVIEETKPTEFNPPTPGELVNTGEPPESKIPVVEMIVSNTTPGDDPEDQNEPDSSDHPRREIQVDPLFEAVFEGRNIPDPETAEIKNEVDRITKQLGDITRDKMRAKIEEIGNPIYRDIMRLRFEGLRFREIGERVFPELDPHAAETKARNRYEYYASIIVESLRQDPIIQKLLKDSR